MTNEPTKYTYFNKVISKSSRSAPDFMLLEWFCEKTGVTEGQIKWIISKRKSNGADFFLYQIGNKQKWMLSPSLFKEWSEQRRKRREKIKIGETNG